MGKEWDKFGKSWKAGTIGDLSTLKNGENLYFKRGFRQLPIFRGADKEYFHTYQSWTNSWAREALRILLPGASILVMGGTRTSHRMACGIEDAGFIIKDTLLWCYNSGMPKAQDLGALFDKRECRKQLEQMLGRKATRLEFKKAWKLFRKVIGKYRLPDGRKWNLKQSDNPDIEHSSSKFIKNGIKGVRTLNITAPVTPLAKEWDGWKVGGLKPAFEPIVWAIKPPEGAVIDNVLKYGVGAINVDECRIPYQNKADRSGWSKSGANGSRGYQGTNTFKIRPISAEEIEKRCIETGGRYPSNMIRTDRFEDGYDKFYFVPKASRAERDKGLEGMTKDKGVFSSMGINTEEGIIQRGRHPEKFTKIKNIHPTVKPIRLMEHLIKLVTREGQIVLDPFVGTGTTPIASFKLGRRWIGIDNSSEYLDIANLRIEAYKKQRTLEGFK